MCSRLSLFCAITSVVLACVHATPLSAMQHSALLSVLDDSTPAVSTAVVARGNMNTICDQDENKMRVYCSGNNVTGLDLHASMLTSLASSLTSLSALTFLSLADNQLGDVALTNVWKLSALRFLDLSGNSMTVLPSQISTLSALVELNVVDNAIDSWPPELSQLPNLQGVKFGGNRLTAVPASVGTMSALVALDVSNNQLDTLPSQLGQLTNLRFLHMFDNKLASVPTDLQLLSALKAFTIFGNRLRNQPFPLTNVASIDQCQAQGVYENSTETNCFIDCPPKCCNSELRWPDCAIPDSELFSTTSTPQTSVAESTSPFSSSSTTASTTDGETNVTSTSPSSPVLPMTSEADWIILYAVLGVVGVCIAAVIGFFIWRWRKKQRGQKSEDVQIEMPAVSNGATFVPEKQVPADDAPPPLARKKSSSRRRKKKSSSGRRNGAYDSVLPETSQIERPYTFLPSVAATQNEYDKFPDEVDSQAQKERDKNDNRKTVSGAWLIDKAQIELGKELGAGAFGVVYAAKWKGSKVAVKQIKQSALEEGGAKGDAARNEFAAELELMAQMQPHANVLMYLGITELANGDLAVVIEYCSKGSLLNALYGDKPRHLSSSQQLRIAHGAACGLSHLHDQGIVHRDIAARNVLLHTNDLIPKLADFGMARQIDEERYDQETLATVGPVRWMAPEQLTGQKYSKRSDVYAFGMLLFEIWAKDKPWPDKTNIAAMSAVLQGESLSPPAAAPELVQQLMRQCWAAKSTARPDTESIRKRLGDLCDAEDSSE